MIHIPKGTKDMLPSQAPQWRRVENIAKETARRYAFEEIRTPTFEYTELFSRGVGDGTDIVNKEMYTFLDKGGRSITLRPEGTAGVARAFSENGLAGGVLPFKAYYLVSAFRYERPQTGRLREFHQFGAELYGAAQPYADAEVISFAGDFLKNLGLENVKLKINSIGCPACRAKYLEAIKDYYRPHLGEMCADCNARFEKNPLRILDCKEEGCKKFLGGVPKITDYLCGECDSHFRAVLSLLDKTGIEYEVDPFIVRGLDYYSRTVFEFVLSTGEGEMTILGGGRYDGLLSQMGEKNVPAVGFAAGLERVLFALDLQHSKAEQEGVSCYLAGMDDASRKRAFLLANELRQNGLSCEVDLMERSVKAQMRYADKTGARFVVVLGEREIAEGAADVKDMKNSSAERVELSALTQYLLRKEEQNG